MTPEQRQEARERCEKATPGHWTAYWRYGMEHPSVGWLGPYAEGINAFATGEAGGWCNAAFAAHARTDLPAALDALDAADAREQEKDARIVELDGAIEAKCAFCDYCGHGSSDETICPLYLYRKG